MLRTGKTTPQPAIMGMMLANVPVIYLGHKFADRLPVESVHIVAALIFLVLGGVALRNALNGTSMMV